MGKTPNRTRRVLIVNTLPDSSYSEALADELKQKDLEYDIFNSNDMNIAHCLGCNQCWLKTPGVCAIKDDYEQILKKLACTDELWVVTDTSLGFISSKAKKIFDRMMPILVMDLEFRNGFMGHKLRYNQSIGVGVIYRGDGDRSHLNWWCERTAGNLNGKGLGAFPINEIKEAAGCM